MRAYTPYIIFLFDDDKFRRSYIANTFVTLIMDS